MASPEEARATQIRNIETKLGRTVDAVRADVAVSGKAKHGEIRSWLIETLGLGYGDANALAGLTIPGAPAPAAAPASSDQALDEIYAGKKAHLRPIHDALIAAITPWGDFEVAPKKGYVALRRKKQFAMLGPKTADRAELGINLKDEVASARILAQKPGGMCQYAVALSRSDEIDDDILAVVKKAFDSAS